MLKQALENSTNQEIFVDARNLLSRKQIDETNIPILFVELKSGQNGTFTLYPGHGVGQTWLGADGATITLERGILKASRGMGNDLMGSNSSMLPWSKIGNNFSSHTKELNYITGNNNISKLVFECVIKKSEQPELLEIWGLKFRATKHKETCNRNDLQIENTYYLDNRGIVRKSIQYHSETIGYLLTERIDR